MKSIPLKVALALMLLLAPSSPSADEISPHELKSFPDLGLTSTSGTRFQHVSGGGSDRCDVTHCLCRVNPERRSAIRQLEATSNRRFSVYFGEAVHMLSQAQTSQIQEFISSQSSRSYTVVGYTDECGTSTFNGSLVQNRVGSVNSAMGLRAPARVDRTVFNAESGPCPDPSSRRVDVIAHTSNRLTTMIDKVQADVYLVDASGSMWSGWNTWTDIISVSFRPGSRVYLSKTAGCTDGQSLDQVGPGGGTEIWYSYWKVLEWMQPGETLAIISDFRADVPLTRRESVLIEQKVRNRNITVIAIAP